MTPVQFLELQLKAKKMEIENLRAQVDLYESLISQVVAKLQEPRGVNPAAIQELADRMGQINTAFQQALANLGG